MDVRLLIASPPKYPIPPPGALYVAWELRSPPRNSTRPYRAEPRPRTAGRSCSSTFGAPSRATIGLASSPRGGQVNEEYVSCGYTYLSGSFLPRIVWIMPVSVKPTRRRPVDLPEVGRARPELPVAYRSSILAS